MGCKNISTVGILASKWSWDRSVPVQKWFLWQAESRRAYQSFHTGHWSLPVSESAHCLKGQDWNRHYEQHIMIFLQMLGSVQNNQRKCASVRLGFILPPYQVHELNFLRLHSCSHICRWRHLFLGSINQLHMLSQKTVLCIMSYVVNSPVNSD